MCLFSSLISNSGKRVALAMPTALKSITTGSGWGTSSYRGPVIDLLPADQRFQRQWSNPNAESISGLLSIAAVALERRADSLSGP
jgi:hypothetical protein